MAGEVQGHQIVVEDAHPIYGAEARNDLDMRHDLIENRLDAPFRLEFDVGTQVLTIKSNEVQLKKSFGNTFVSSFKSAPAPVSSHSTIAESTINLNTGATTGDFASNPADSVSITDTEYLYIGVELRSDSKFYVVKGTPDAVEGSASRANFTATALAKICEMGTLQKTGGSGAWGFVAIGDTAILKFESSGAGGGGASAGLIPTSETSTTLGVSTGKITYYAREIELSTALASVTADVSSDSVWYVYLDIEAVAANSYTILTSHFFFSTDAPESGAINLDKHLPRGKYTVASGSITLDTVEGYVDSTFGDFKGTMPLTEKFSLDVTTNTTANQAHGLSGIPNQFFVKYDDGAGTVTILDPTAVITDFDATSFDYDSGAFTLGTGETLTIEAQYILDTRTIVSAPTNNFESVWYSASGPATLAHGLGSNIKSYVLLEKTTSNGKIREVDPSTVIDDFDGTNFNLDWTAADFTDAEYKIVASTFTTLPAAVPFNAEGTIIVADSGGSFTTLWAALAVATAGQKILVKSDQTTAIQRIINQAVTIEFQSGVKVVCSTQLASSIIQFGADVITKNFELELTHTSGTTTSGFEFAGNEGYHDNIKFKMNGVGGTVTDAFKLNSGSELNFGRGLAHQVAGTITNSITDSSGVTNNDLQTRNKA